jgi:predicted phosphoribosyltransferase
MLPTAHFVDRCDAGRRLGVALRKRADDRPLINRVVAPVPFYGVGLWYRRFFETSEAGI